MPYIYVIYRKGGPYFHCGEANKRFHWPYDFFSLVKIYRISILIGYTVFVTSEENRIVILLVFGKERKGIWLFYV